MIICNILFLSNSRPKTQSRKIKAEIQGACMHEVNAYHCSHKLTYTIVDICDRSGVKKIVIGDLTDIRVKANYSKKSNFKIHSWTFKK